MSAETARNSYEALGGHLTRFSSFGTDPLGHCAELVHLREQQLADPENVQEAKAEGVNESYRLYRNKITKYADITRTLSTK